MDLQEKVSSSRGKMFLVNYLNMYSVQQKNEPTLDGKMFTFYSDSHE